MWRRIFRQKKKIDEGGVRRLARKGATQKELDEIEKFNKLEKKREKEDYDLYRIKEDEREREREKISRSKYNSFPEYNKPLNREEKLITNEIDIQLEEEDDLEDEKYLLKELEEEEKKKLDKASTNEEKNIIKRKIDVYKMESEDIKNKLKSLKEKNSILYDKLKLQRLHKSQLNKVYSLDEKARLKKLKKKESEKKLREKEK